MTSELEAAVGKTAARSSLLACAATGHPLIDDIDSRMKNDVPNRHIQEWLASRNAEDPAIPRVGEHTLRKHRLVCLGLPRLSAQFVSEGADSEAPSDKELRDALKADLMSRVSKLEPADIMKYTEAIRALSPKAASAMKPEKAPPANQKGARARAAITRIRDRIDEAS